MIKNYMSANTVVRKISFKNEMDLHATIEDNMVYDSIIYKLAQVVPICETEAYIVLTPDLDKMVVVFCDISEPNDEAEEDDELFDNSPNGNMVIMSLAEIELLKKLETAHIGDDSFEIEGMDMFFDGSAQRHMMVYVRKEA